MTKQHDISPEGRRRRDMAFAQQKLAELATAFNAKLDPLDTGGLLIAAGFATLAQKGGVDFAADWLRSFLEEHEKSEESGEAWPSDHGHT